MKTLVALAFLIAAADIADAKADELEDAYKAGHDAGFQEGYALALQIKPGSVFGNASIVIPGTKFDTAIDSGGIAGTNFQISPDSSVAIIPNDALSAMKQKLGTDFLVNNNIQLNNSSLAMP